MTSARLGQNRRKTMQALKDSVAEEPLFPLEGAIAH
jgi:hypothetical protein